MASTAAGWTNVIDPSIRAVAFKLTLDKGQWKRMLPSERLERLSIAWVVNPFNHYPDYAIAYERPYCLGVYRIDGWERAADGRRMIFRGTLDEELTARYEGEDISADVGRAPNPVRYLNC
jgi:hypothetical protein